MANAGTTTYSGEFRPTLDDKNRVTIPSAWRYVHSENDEFLAIPQTDGSINILPPDATARIREKAAAIPISSVQGRQVMTRLFASSRTVTFDKQGRIAISDAHRAHAKIDKEVVLVGSGDRFVIYSPELWEQISKPQDDDNDILAKLGI
ncbi:division/cell wall cluster transcriptional repressor MraZ [Geminisphaera colitermitum]|uniref:division/cell wall cluster transcriptional repressor MraZ n=1 Tax=Geminisphaera colitermitum TaxID=1148786 RepID=UPI000158D5EE|nr:division/cell wall cluster transcriptional repressor MraZ [Geminisphaera colitermitum]